MKNKKLSFKVECSVEDYNQKTPKKEVKTLYINADDESEAESLAKYHFLCVKENFSFLGVKSIVKL